MTDDTSYRIVRSTDPITGAPISLRISPLQSQPRPKPPRILSDDAIRALDGLDNFAFARDRQDARRARRT